MSGARKAYFHDVHVIFFAGGGKNCPFASVVVNGAKAAEKDFGCRVDCVWSDWLPAKMVAQFEEVIAEKPDGIAIMGHPGDSALEPLVEKAVTQGIIVTSLNAALPYLEEKYKDKGFGYVGQELYESGFMLAKAAAKRAGLRSGDKALVWGLLSQKTRGLRSKGCIDALEGMQIKVEYMEISDAVNADASLGAPVLAGYLKEHPETKMIITDHGALTSELANYLKTAGKKPGEIFGVGFDLSPATVSAIKEGWVGAILDQQPWLQGYFAVLQVCLTKKYAFAGLHVDTGGTIIDAANIDLFAVQAIKGIR